MNLRNTWISELLSSFNGGWWWLMLGHLPIKDLFSDVETIHVWSSACPSLAQVRVVEIALVPVSIPQQLQPKDGWLRNWSSTERLGCPPRSVPCPPIFHTGLLGRSWGRKREDHWAPHETQKMIRTTQLMRHYGQSPASTIATDHFHVCFATTIKCYCPWLLWLSTVPSTSHQNTMLSRGWCSFFTRVSDCPSKYHGNLPPPRPALNHQPLTVMLIRWGYLSWESELM